jgi:hypothetical protein
MSKAARADTEPVTERAHSTSTLRSSGVSKVVLAATCLAVSGAIIAVPTAAWAVPVPWKNCGSAGDAISIQRFDASVWPPQAGEPLTLNYSWVLGETLTKGSFEHVLTTWPSGRVSDTWVNFEAPVPVLFDDALFGHYASPKTTRVPIAPGPYSQSLTLRVPPKGSATQPLAVDMTGFDASGRQVLCMQLIIPIK